MKKLYVSLLLSFIVSITYSQEKIYQDDKLEAYLTVQKITDKKNDIFYDYYVLHVKNTSSESVTFIPVFMYKNDRGEELTTESRDEVPIYTLAPGEEITGHIENERSLTLFKQFNIGNSGNRASESKNSNVSLMVKYQ